MNSFDDALWKALEGMEIAPAGAALTFDARLAREQGWSPGHAHKVMREYRRFLYLAAKTPGQVTPSEAVDAAWHLHLTYTRHYWEVLCPNILGAPLHHNPTEGGPAERARFHDQYAQSLAVYEATFGEAPPAEVWPEPEARLGAPRRGWPWRGLSAAAGASVLLAACTALAGNSAPEEGMSAAAAVPIVVSVFVFVMLAALIFGAKSKKQNADGSCSSFFGSDGGGDCSDGGGDSGCGGGCGGGGGCS